MTKYAANVVLIDFVVRSDMLGCPAHKRTSFASACQCLGCGR